MAACSKHDSTIGSTHCHDDYHISGQVTTLEAFHPLIRTAAHKHVPERRCSRRNLTHPIIQSITVLETFVLCDWLLRGGGGETPWVAPVKLAFPCITSRLPMNTCESTKFLFLLLLHLLLPINPMKSDKSFTDKPFLTLGSTTNTFVVS